MIDNILEGWDRKMADDPVQGRESDGAMAEERWRAERTAAQMRKLGHAITYILWGYVLLHLDFNVETMWDYNYVTGETVGGALNLLPDWQLEVEVYGLAGIIVAVSLLVLMVVVVWTGVVLGSLKKYLDRGVLETF